VNFRCFLVGATRWPTMILRAIRPRTGCVHSGTECLVHVEVTCLSVSYPFDFRYAMDFVIVVIQLFVPASLNCSANGYRETGRFSEYLVFGRINSMWKPASSYKCEMSSADVECLFFCHYKRARERYAFLVGLVAP
jgi:hypothetical protein